ncbi:wall-associated kinase family protein [Artemisia annua]|uniref:Wall-associated kinase family protein n=1 Tax=Artemisia annua TaxID=35608 RepID=A0A2U1NPZ4_ARTAN|nr:wall-associated kinase family protein [Artemisia annua]
MKLFQAYHLLLFLSIIATSIAIPKYAKPGCIDTCGKVRIPYPFGIGTKCSVNKWYVIDCNYSTPYLSAVNNLQVLGVNLDDQTVTVNGPMVSNCQNTVQNTSQTMSIDLGSSLFLFSKLHKKLVVEGCGNGVILEHGSALTGCSTACINDTVSDKNNCLGFSCCQTTIPHYLKSYSVNLRGLERHGGDGGCGSAFLVDQGNFQNERLHIIATRGYYLIIIVQLLGCIWKVCVSLRALECQLDLYLERSIGKDKVLESDIRKVCLKLADSIKETKAFAKECDVIKGRVEAVESAKFLRDRVHKDSHRLMALMISMKETELSQREKDLFGEKLKGWLPF